MKCSPSCLHVSWEHEASSIHGCEFYSMLLLVHSNSSQRRSPSMQYTCIQPDVVVVFSAFSVVGAAVHGVSWKLCGKLCCILRLWKHPVSIFSFMNIWGNLGCVAFYLYWYWQLKLHKSITGQPSCLVSCSKPFAEVACLNIALSPGECCLGNRLYTPCGGAGGLECAKWPPHREGVTIT